MVTFQGSPKFNGDGSEYVLQKDKGESQYVGPPNEDIDRAWDDLTWGEFGPTAAYQQYLTSV